jgi:ABC-2 type transport system ATP-binding protein
MLEMVGLTPAAKRKFRGYSLGMRQRLGIAAAMLGDPKALILDEPANGLDPEGIRWMRDLLKKFASEGRTVLVSSHLLAEMELLADDIIIIANGKLITQGAVDTVVGGMSQTERVRVRTPDPERLVLALPSQAKSAQENGALLVTGVDAPAVGAAALKAGVELHELVAEKPDLEQVFLELTAGKAGIR